MMKQRPVKLGLIGCGLRPRMLFSLLSQHRSKRRIQITALCDPSQKARQAARKAFGLRTALEYSDHKLLLKDSDIDWVLISSPNHLHMEHLLDAFAAGKNVFCEKPLAIHPQEVLAMHKAWKKSKRQFVFGLCLRYSPLHTRVSNLLGTGVVGKIVSMEFNETLGFNHGGYIMGNWRRHRELAGTHLLEKCCHDLDLANWFCASLPVRAASFGGLSFFHPGYAGRIKAIGTDANGRMAYRSWVEPGGLNPFTSKKSIVDHQVAIIEYGNGVRATFHTNCNAAIPERRFYILGTEGALRCDLQTGVIEWQRIGFDTQRHSEKIDLTGGHGGADEN
ncbi:Gfo/Idh/MocA family oxidoreductase [Oscillatoria laete-virens NRMC-F 0139]|nr:Gfo/Idh/MocA family oxidoreductase [Oscillatoria laete-virens]MDL5055205.1 Gfo/Idh/MocA family oxidoreductase [Oscillatoria laete-virens NRMC-F 0139]